MKAGDTAYIVESNRYIREVKIIRINGDMFLVRFTDNAEVSRYAKTAYFLQPMKLKPVYTKLQALRKEKHQEVLMISGTRKRPVFRPFCVIIMTVLL